MTIATRRRLPIFALILAIAGLAVAGTTIATRPSHQRHVVYISPWVPLNGTPLAHSR